MPTFEVFRTFEKKTRIHFIGTVTGPGVPWGFSSDKYCKSSPQKRFYHFNIPTWRQAGLRSRHPRRLEMRIPANRYLLAWENGIQVPFPFFIFA